MVDGNFKKFFNLVKEIIPIMRQNYWGRVITIDLIKFKIYRVGFIE